MLNIINSDYKIEDKVSSEIENKNSDSMKNQNDQKYSENDSEHIDTFVTKDKKYLDQYYKLRGIAYKKEWDLDGFDQEFEHDKKGHIAVCVNSKDEVIGGMRLIFSNECKFLASEVPGTQYEYKKYIKKYDDRENLIISEFSAFVVAEGYRNTTITSYLLKYSIEKSIEHGCNYTFGVTNLAIARSYRITLKKIGHFLEIVINFPWQQKKIYNFMKMFPIYIKFN